jgi:hypothetical protein
MDLMVVYFLIQLFLQFVHLLHLLILLLIQEQKCFDFLHPHLLLK